MFPRVESAEQLAGLLRTFSLSRVLTTSVVTGTMDAVAERGPMTVSELAEHLVWPADRTARFVRTLVALGVLGAKDGKDDTVTVTPLGRLLVKDESGSLAPVARMLHSEGWSAWSEFPQWLAHEKPDDDVFDTFAGDSATYAVFNDQMVAGSARHAPMVVAAAALTGDESVLDVGGGSGAMAQAILQAHPETRVTIGDRGYARTGAHAHLAGIAADRWSFQEMNFFDHVLPGFDVYLLSRILHDWDDARALFILRACAQAMAPDARLLVFDRATKDGTDLAFRMGDLNTGLMCGGRERTSAETAALLRAAGLRVHRTTPITGAHHLFDARKDGTR